MGGVREGRVRDAEQGRDGIEAPRGAIAVLRTGRNTGTLRIRVSGDS